MKKTAWIQLSLFVSLCFPLVACKRKQAPAPKPAAPVAAPAPAKPATTAKPPQTAATGRKKVVRGRPIQGGATVALSTLLAKPRAYAGKSVIFTGKVRQVCRKRGCWMEVAPSMAKSAQGCRVTFKDYGFFVPKDADGSEARVQGVLRIRKVPKSQVDHLEAEGARFASKLPDGTAHEVRVVATGVELTR